LIPKKSQSYAPGDLDELLQQAKNHKYTLIVDTAGMGKSTVVTRLSKIINQKYPAYWLVTINFNDYTEIFTDQKGKKMDKG
jgi:energy-coupling factor transporter ATP-binding protein EcfA2